ncbi:MAG: DUF481 domain-containing protein, partial [Planctomycetota bacterium]
GLIERVEYGLAPDEVPVGPTLAEPVVPLVSAANDTGPPPRFGPTRWYANPVTAGVRGTLTLLSLDPDEVFGEINEWTRRVEIGGSWVRGNNQIFRFTSGGLLERRSGRYAVAAEWGGRFARNQGEVDENRWWLNTNLDNDRGGDWLLFWTARHEYDEFRDLHYRGTFATGAGYRVIDDEEHRLILRLGPGAVVESFEQPRGTDVTGNLLAEVDLRWPVWQRTIVEHRTTGNRAFDAAGDVRLINSSGLVVPLDEDGRWSFRLGLRHEYESRPNAGRANNDVTTSIRLVYTRKPGDKNRKVKAPQILP